VRLTEPRDLGEIDGTYVVHCTKLRSRRACELRQAVRFDVEADRALTGSTRSRTIRSPSLRTWWRWFGRTAPATSS